MLGDVRHPKLVGRIGGEHSFHFVVEHGRQAARTPVSPFAVMDSLQSGQTHQSFDATMTDPQAPTQD